MQTFSSFAIDCVFCLNPLKRCCLDFLFVCVGEHAFVHLFAAFVSGEFTIKKKRGGWGGAAPPHLQTFSSFAIDCVLYSIKKSGGVGGGAAPPICKLFSPFAIDCVFFVLNPLQRCCLAFPFLCVCAPTPQNKTSRPQKAADRGTAGPGDHGTRGPEDQRTTSQPNLLKDSL